MKTRKTLRAVVLLGLLAPFAFGQSLLTGTHFADPTDFPMLKRLGYDFAVITLNPHDDTTWKPMLDAAEAAGLKLIVGGYPPPYIFDNVQWTITGSGVDLLNYLKSRSNVILALYVFNEPYSTNPFGGESYVCGYFTAEHLRGLRATIQSLWPSAKIYHDLGEPMVWAPGSDFWKTYTCIGNKYADQSGVADYAGIWYYPFTENSYERQKGLDELAAEVNFVRKSMQPAVPIILNQSYKCAACLPGLVFPAPDQLLDWNCATRKLGAVGMSWYPFKQSSYEEDLYRHAAQMALTTQDACGMGMGSGAVAVSAADGGPIAASESIVSVYGEGFSAGVSTAPGPPQSLPTSLAGASIQLRDRAGISRLAPLFFVSPRQINFQIPAATAPGQAAITVVRSSGPDILGTTVVQTAAPALFTADGSGRGAPAATALRVTGSQLTSVAVFQCATGGACAPVPIDLTTGTVYLSLYGTGIRGYTSTVTCAINSANVPVLYVGAQGSYAGLDQVNIVLPASLRRAGETDLVLMVDGVRSNTVRLDIR